MIKAINEDRMLKLIHNFFENPQSLVTELVQNAVRAKAKNITINTKDGRLSVIDDGEGCDLIAPLLTLAESDWDEKIEQNQQPAGWGLFIVYCLAKEVEITSRFGTLSFDTELFLNDTAYRSIILSLVEVRQKRIGIPSMFLDSNRKAEGFQISATLKNPELEQKITSISDSVLRFFPINIRINGKNIEQASVEKGYNDFLIKTTYMGNEVLMGTEYGFPRSVNEFDVIWYGFPIYASSIGNPKGVINITQGSPLTPVLPFRTSIKQNEKFTKFWGFVRQMIVDYCIDQINNNKTEDPLPLMRAMGNLATQEELNKLDQFYVIKTQPYYDTGDDMNREHLKVTKEKAVVSNDIEVRLVENGKQGTLKPRMYHRKTNKWVGDYEAIFLANDAIVQYETPGNSPEWLKVTTRVHRVVINIPKKTKKYSGNLIWYKSKIVSDINLGVIGINTGYGLDATVIYYGKCAEEVWGLQRPIVGYLYNDEGDSFDTQESWVESQIGEDLQNVTDDYNKYDLLEGFQKVSKIKVADIRNIAIGEKKMSITLKRGKKKTLSLA